jgi:hypothetical protein
MSQVSQNLMTPCCQLPDNLLTKAEQKDPSRATMQILVTLAAHCTAAEFILTRGQP